MCVTRKGKVLNAKLDGEHMVRYTSHNKEEMLDLLIEYLTKRKRARPDN